MAASRAGLTGVAQLNAQLAALGEATRKRALRAAVRAAGNVVVRAARTKAPVGTEPHKTYKGRLVAPGFAKRSVRQVVRLNREGDTASAAIGVRAEAFYATQFVEVGMPSRGIPAQPWLRPALAESQEAAEAALAASLRKSLLAAIRSKA